MGMVSMKTESEGYTEPYTPNPYGYGLCICLTEEQVEALGLSRNPPAPGTTVLVQAIARVKRVSQESDPAEEMAEGEAPDDIDTCMELQITDMEVTPGTARTPAEFATLLYGA